MPTEEHDYLLYEEYLKNFRKTHHPRAQAMSEDQYEQMRAKAAQKQAKMNAAEEAGTASWWEQDGGPADEIIQEATGKENPTHEEAMAKIQETAEQKLTREQQGKLAKGNTYENKVANKNTIDDTKAIGASKEELDNMLQDGLISKDAYDKQIAALQTPEVQEEMARGEKKADETVWDSSNREVANNALTDSVSEAVTPKKDDPEGVVQSKNKYNKSMMSIWDAYRAGEISKETAGYFTIDAIATLAKNLGRSIGNVGAQFSGGTIDNGHDESKWGQRQNALLNEEIGKETESLGGAAGRKAESENIANLEARIRANYSPKILDLEIKNLENEVKKSGIDVTTAENSQALIEHIKQQDPDYENKPIKLLFIGLLSQIGVGGAVNTGASVFERLALLRGK